MRTYIFCVTFCLLACGNEKTQPQPVFNLTVKYGPVRLLETPGEKGKPLAELPAQTLLADQNQTSPFVTPLSIQDQQFQTPWTKVITVSGQTGWVIAAALSQLQADANDWYLNQQMRAFMGQKLITQRNTWLEKMQNPQNALDFSNCYQEALHLRDTLVQRLAMRTEPNEADFRPDYSWLTAAMPGFVFQWVEGQPYLFADYRFWGNLAQKTTQDTLDNQFINLCEQAFPTDSIESFFPVWMIQTGENTACSRLGEGKHLAMFQHLEALYQNPQARQAFGPNLDHFKGSLLTDMLGKNTCYWQPLDKILKEIKAIDALPYSILSTRDHLELKASLPMFSNPGDTKRKINARNG
jgi:hypothetical protein